MPMSQTASGLRIVLLALAACFAGCTAGCQSQSVSVEPVPGTASPNFDVRVQVVQGLPEDPVLGLIPSPTNFSTAPDSRKQIRCRVLSQADMAAVQLALYKQGLAVLSAPRILASSGQTASVECESDPGIALRLDMTTTSMPDGTLRLTLAYRERDGGYVFPETQFTLKPGESAAALVQTDHDKGGTVRTLLVTPALVASR